MKLDLPTICVFLAAFLPAFVFWLAAVIEKRRRERTEKPPQQEKLLRPPGYSLSLRLDELQDKVLYEMLAACAVCGFAGACGVTLGLFLGANAPILWTAGAAVGLAAFSITGAWMAVRSFQRATKMRDVRLGLRGEQSVAEVLHELGDAGYRAFHDLPGGPDWNIDHVIVGPQGVWVIETKARRRRPGKRNQRDYVVHVAGDILRFPFGDDREAIPQARRNANWIANYLTKKTGEQVGAQSFVVIPGWWVEAGRGYPPKAMNADYLGKFLRSQRDKQKDKLPPAQVRRIIAALDEKCRDLEF